MNLKDVPGKLRKRNGAVNGKLVKLNWTEEAKNSFEKLKEETSQALTIYMPDFNKPFELTTDASEHGYGAYLSQTKDNKEQIVGYYSKTYSPAQKKYATNEKELLAIVMAIEHFHIYLYGRKFVVYTDHMPLTYLLNKITPSKRLERWKERMHIYTFEIKYKPGSENIIADALSRYNEDAEGDNAGNSMDYEEEYNDILIASNTCIEDERMPLETYYALAPYSIIHRINIISEIPSSSTDEEYEIYKSEQDADEDIKWIKSLITEHGEDRPTIKTFENNVRRVYYNEYNSLKLIYGLLYKEKESPKGKRSIHFALPKDTVLPVLKKIHTTIYGAHLGRKKTTKKTLDRFYRPFLADDIKEFIRSCDTCQKIKTLTKKHRAEMKIISPSRPGQIIASDFAGPLCPTPEGNKYIQIITDLFTKTLMVKAVPNKETTTAVKTIVENWCCMYGFPEKCLTDRGKEYQSGIWDATCELLDIRRIKTTPFHPECDGQSERVVQTVKKMITCYVNDNQDNWDEFLPQLTYAYNTSVHDSTKFSPFEMTYGYVAKIPIDLMYPDRNNLMLSKNSPRPNRTETRTIKFCDTVEEFNLNEESTSNEEFDQLKDMALAEIVDPKVIAHLDSLKRKLRKSYECLKLNKHTRMVYAKEAHDRQIKRETYHLNDKVLCNHPQVKKGQTMGLSPKYYGPFIIVGTNKNRCDYLIKRLNSPRARTKQVHKNNLKIYYDGGIEQSIDPNALAPESQPAIETLKRSYNKDPKNQRWNKTLISKDSESALSQSESDQEPVTTVADAEKSSEDEILSIPRRKYTKNPNAPRWNMKQPIIPNKSGTTKEIDLIQPTIPSMPEEPAQTLPTTSGTIGDTAPVLPSTSSAALAVPPKKLFSRRGRSLKAPERFQ